MTDIERRLRELGDKVRDEQGPMSLDSAALRRVKRRRLATVSTGLLAVAALISIGTYALGALNEESARLPPAEDKNTEEVEKRVCKRPVDFEPSYVPEGWIQELQEGSGGGGEPEAVIGHYGNDTPAGTPEKAEGGFADLFVGTSPYAISNGQEIRVLDEPAVLGEIHEGYAVEFTQHDCDYTLVAYGIRLDELRYVAEGLRLPGEYVSPERGEKTDPEHFGAVWPEDTYRQAKEACDAGSDAEAVRRADPESIASAFGIQVLGWQEPLVVGAEEPYSKEGVYELRRSANSRPAVLIFPIEVVPDCWSIGSVARMPDEESEHHGSMSVHGREVQMGFELPGASSAIFEVGYGGNKTTHAWQGGQGGVEFQLDFEPRGKGHFLVLLMDADGKIFSAFGSALPAGDFAAG